MQKKYKLRKEKIKKLNINHRKDIAGIESKADEKQVKQMDAELRKIAKRLKNADFNDKVKSYAKKHKFTEAKAAIIIMGKKYV